MGLTSNNTTKKIYLQIVGGKFAQRVEKGTQGAVERKNKKEATVYELLHDRVSGKIKEIKVEKNEFGKQILIIMEEVGEVYVITLPVESKYSDSFCSKVGSADLSSTIELVPYSFQPADSKTKRTGLNLYQNGVKLDYFFTKENPKNKPVPHGGGLLSEEDYKIFKLQERKFFCEYISGMDKIPAKKEDVVSSQISSGDSLPF